MRSFLTASALAFFAAGLAGFAACQSQSGTGVGNEAPGVIAPRTPNEWMAFTTSITLGSRTTAYNLLSAGKITPEQAKQVNSLADSALAAVDGYLNAASAPGRTPSVAAMGAAVTALTTYLASLQVQHK